MRDNKRMDFERTLTPAALAGLLGVSVGTLARWRKAGCPHTETKENGMSARASRPRYNADEVKAWLAARREEKEVQA